MSISDRFDLTNAAALLAIANTPLFLSQKLQAEPAVKMIGSELPGQEILDELKAAVRQKPRNLFEAVVPYALLVALYQNPQSAYLRQAAGIKPVYDDEWFTYLQNALSKMYQPTTRQVLELRLNPNVSTTTSSASSQRIIIGSGSRNRTASGVT